jgi:DNA-binding transcriptional LysR family regulator
VPDWVEPKEVQDVENQISKKPWPEIRELLMRLVPVGKIDEDGYEKAAAELGLSAAGLRSRLDLLADKLKVEREDIVSSGKGAAVAPVGKPVQALCDAIERHVAEFYSQVELVKTDLPKTKSELLLAIISSAWDVVEQDWKSIPGIHLLVQPNVSRVVQTEILNGEADVAIAYDPESLNPALDKKSWSKEPMVLVVSERCANVAREARSHRFRKQGPKPATSEDIRKIAIGRDFYLMSEGAPMTDLVKSYLAANGIELQRLVARQTVMEAIDLISQDKGISIIPIRNAEKNRKVKNLVIFPLDVKLFRHLSIIYRRGSPKQKAVEAFIDFACKDNPYPARKPHQASPRPV